MRDLIDLRSDTVTRPSAAMRAAIAAAPVGDDQFGEDPTVNLLQERVADVLGKEAALWLPTGTMANQVALRVLTRPGDDVIVSRESHVVWHETGAAAANAGVQFTAIGEKGVFTREEFLAALKPRGHIIYPPTTLVGIENTHNRAGGVVFPLDDDEASLRGRRRARHRDLSRRGAARGTRPLSSGRPPMELAAPFDLVSVALSKGLGAPGGSLLAGSSELIRHCVRYRRMLGRCNAAGRDLRRRRNLCARPQHRNGWPKITRNSRLIASRALEEQTSHSRPGHGPDQHPGVRPGSGRPGRAHRGDPGQGARRSHLCVRPADNSRRHASGRIPGGV